MALAQIQQALPAFKSAVETGTGDFASARSSMNKLKLLMTEVPSQQGSSATTPVIAADEAAVCREVLDYACLLSVKLNDPKSFERNVAQAELYYSTGQESSEAAQRRVLITGLHLMFLLVEGRLADFHMRVETLSEEERVTQPIALPLRIEALLGEGSYNKVLAARSSLPSQLVLFGPLLDRLSDTVRDNIAQCATAAYPSLKVADAVSLLRLGSPAELEAYCRAKGLPWGPDPSQPGRMALGGAGKVKPALNATESMATMLAYATDIERIV